MRSETFQVNTGGRAQVYDLTPDCERFVDGAGDGLLSVVAGRMQLGTWQSVCLVDTNRDNPERSVRLSFLAG